MSSSLSEISISLPLGALKNLHGQNGLFVDSVAGKRGSYSGLDALCLECLHFTCLPQCFICVFMYACVCVAARRGKTDLVGEGIRDVISVGKCYSLRETVYAYQTHTHTIHHVHTHRHCCPPTHTQASMVQGLPEQTG